VSLMGGMCGRWVVCDTAGWYHMRCRWPAFANGCGCWVGLLRLSLLGCRAFFDLSGVVVAHFVGGCIPSWLFTTSGFCSPHCRSLCGVMLPRPVIRPVHVIAIVITVTHAVGAV